MTFDSSKILHQAYPLSRKIAEMVNGTTPISAVGLSAHGLAGPSAVGLAALIHAGQGSQAVIEQLRQMQFSSEDSKTIAAAIAAKGAQ